MSVSSMRRPGRSWVGLVAAAIAALALAMGLGRFAYTPILPMMMRGAGLDATGGSVLASGNYLGYLIGSLATVVWHGPLCTRTAVRCSAVALVVSMVAMPLTSGLLLWCLWRSVAGIASAVIFIATTEFARRGLVGADARRFGYVYAGVGLGITASSLLPLTADWREAWWALAIASAALTLGAWRVGSPHTPAARAHPVQPRVATPGRVVTDAAASPRRPASAERRPFVLLCIGYGIEGAAYIIGATFLVAALKDTGAAWLSAGAWAVVGLAVLPSVFLWSAATHRYPRHLVLVGCLVLQGIGLAVLSLGGSLVTAVVGAACLGGTFLGAVIIAFSHGTALVGPRAAPVLTALYSVGQVVGPLVVAPLLSSGYAVPLRIGAVLAILGAGCTLLTASPEAR